MAAGLAARRMPRDSLGPTRSPQAGQSSVSTELENVAAGLISGLRHVWQRHKARGALIATSAHRFLYGILLLMSILLYRNYFFPGTNGNTALAHFLPVVVSSALGYGAAAWLTPVATNRMSSTTWVTAMLVLGGVATGTLGLTFSQPQYVAIGFILGVVAQSITISTTTILQQNTGDEYLGRVFSVNDMLYNASFVVGAAACAGFLPASGHSVTMLVIAAAGYLAAAAMYWMISGYPRPDSLAHSSSSSTARS